MKSLLEAGTRQAVLARIERIDGSSKSLWGHFTASEMLAHLSQSLKMAVGELPTVSAKLPIRFFPLKQLVVYLVPFPKGVPTSPELLAAASDPMEKSKEELRRLFPKFAETGVQGKWPEHPAFGSLTTRAWGVLMYRHTDHHLRQFGL
jgi:hypothetical protein